MRIRARAASLCVAAFAVLVLLPAAAQAQDPVLTLDETNVFDSDGDGVFDPVDNCDNDANPTQANLDGDAFGDACDPDDDSDGVPDAVDNCPRIINFGQADGDGNGVGDACDAIATTEGFIGGGGRLGLTHMSFSLHSRGGKLTGTGRVVDDTSTVEILTLTALRTTELGGGEATGMASINGGDPVEYRLSLGDDSNFIVFHAGDRRWIGALSAGNFIVK